MVPKAFKEVKQQVDIVGKGRGDHGDSSWKGFAVFSRRTCHYRLCQVIYAHPSDNSHTSFLQTSPQSHEKLRPSDRRVSPSRRLNACTTGGFCIMPQGDGEQVGPLG